MAATKIDDLQAALEAAEASLAELRKLYADDPRNPKLSRQFGEANTRAIQLRRAAHPKPPKPERLKPERYLDNREWVDALPPHCPKCQGRGVGHFDFGPLRSYGYSVRVGNKGVQCLICRSIYQLEI